MGLDMERAASFCEKWNMLPAGALVLCAVSGGRDSMALLHLLLDMAEKGGFRVAAAHFNHRLRPTADRDEAFVRDWCRARDVPLVCGIGDARAFARQAGTSLEDAARTLRYQFLESTADRLGAERIATAHHREDNAETVLLHLLRGSGLQGLGGIPPVRGRIVRPLLEMGREDINSYIQMNSIPFVEDETNRDTAFPRNRLRLEVLPLLGQDPAMGRRLVRTMGRRLGVELSRSQVEAVLALSSGGYLDLPGGLCAVRQPHRLILRKRTVLPPPLVLRMGAQDWGPWRVVVRPGGPAAENDRTVVLKACPGTLTIAAWDGRGRLAVENGSRTIKRLFADRGIPVECREEHPALHLNGVPAAVFGVATDWEHRPRPGEGCLVIELLM